MRAERAALRIGEVARRTGIGVATLRAWERRYGLLRPIRTAGGHRRYSDEDVDRVRSVQALVDDGWAVTAAAAEVKRAAGARPAGGDRRSGGPPEEVVARLQTAMDGFDEAALEQALDDAFSRMSVPAALDDVVLPALRWVGAGWEDDDRVIAREHLTTNILRPRLQRLLRDPTTATGRSLVAATPEHEEHDLGVLAASVVAAAVGYRVHFLGARTPTRALQRAVRELAPVAVLVGGVSRGHAGELLDGGPVLDGVPLVLGGPAFASDDAERLPRTVVHQGPLRGLPATIRRARELVAPAG